VIDDQTVTSVALTNLEREMGRLCAERNARVDAAEAAIREANRAFDRAAVPLGRQINKLRNQINQNADSSKPIEFRGHDPEWTQEDIDHYYELLRHDPARPSYRSVRHNDEQAK
jgi:hypothetical protein